MKSFVIVKLLVVNNKGQVLGVRRGLDAPRRAGEWDLPGGWVGKGEDLTEAVLRETKEETGISLDHAQVIFAMSEIASEVDEYSSGTWITFVAHTDTTPKVTLGFEGQESAWLKPSELYGRINYDRQRKMLRYVIDNQLIEQSLVMRESHSAGGIVVDPQGRVLVVNQRGDSWSLPKGHVGSGETPRKAAEREIQEESGISNLKFVRGLSSYTRYRIGKGGKGEDQSELKTITIFLFTTNQTDLAPIDKNHPVAKWVKTEGVADLLTHPKDKEFFRSVLPDLQSAI